MFLKCDKCLVVPFYLYILSREEKNNDSEIVRSKIMPVFMELSERFLNEKSEEKKKQIEKDIQCLMDIYMRYI